MTSTVRSLGVGPRKASPRWRAQIRQGRLFKGSKSDWTHARGSADGLAFSHLVSSLPATQKSQEIYTVCPTKTFLSLVTIAADEEAIATAIQTLSRPCNHPAYRDRLKNGP